MTRAFRQDIDSMYAFAAQCDRLSTLVPALCEVLRRNEDSLADVTYAYRLVASDTGYRFAFRLRNGQFSELGEADPVDVTVSGTEANLLAVFQRKLNPVTGMMLGKIRINGSKTALIKLTSFL